MLARRRREISLEELASRVEQLSGEIGALIAKHSEATSQKLAESIRVLQAQVVALLDEQRAILADLVDLLRRQRGELEGSRAKLEDSIACLLYTSPSPRD